MGYFKITTRKQADQYFFDHGAISYLDSHFPSSCHEWSEQVFSIHYFDKFGNEIGYWMPELSETHDPHIFKARRTWPDGIITYPIPLTPEMEDRQANLQANEEICDLVDDLKDVSEDIKRRLSGLTYSSEERERILREIIAKVDELQAICGTKFIKF